MAEEEPEWKCSVCSRVNASAKSKCVVCGTKKGYKKAPLAVPTGPAAGHQDAANIPAVAAGAPGADVGCAAVVASAAVAEPLAAAWKCGVCGRGNAVGKVKCVICGTRPGTKKGDSPTSSTFSGSPKASSARGDDCTEAPLPAPPAAASADAAAQAAVPKLSARAAIALGIQTKQAVSAAAGADGTPGSSATTHLGLDSPSCQDMSDVGASDQVLLSELLQPQQPCEREDLGTPTHTLAAKLRSETPREREGVGALASDLPLAAHLRSELQLEREAILAAERRAMDLRSELEVERSTAGADAARSELREVRGLFMEQLRQVSDLRTVAAAAAARERNFEAQAQSEASKARGCEEKVQEKERDVVHLRGEIAKLQLECSRSEKATHDKERRSTELLLRRQGHQLARQREELLAQQRAVTQVAAEQREQAQAFEERLARQRHEAQCEHSEQRAEFRRTAAELSLSALCRPGPAAAVASSVPRAGGTAGEAQHWQQQAQALDAQLQQQAVELHWQRDRIRAQREELAEREHVHRQELEQLGSELERVLQTTDPANSCLERLHRMLASVREKRTPKAEHRGLGETRQAEWDALMDRQMECLRLAQHRGKATVEGQGGLGHGGALRVFKVLGTQEGASPRRPRSGHASGGERVAAALARSPLAKPVGPKGRRPSTAQGGRAASAGHLGRSPLPAAAAPADGIGPSASCPWLACAAAPDKVLHIHSRCGLVPVDEAPDKKPSRHREALALAGALRPSARAADEGTGCGAPMCAG